MSMILDMAIGLAAVFALLSLMCSALHEFLLGQLGRVRSRVLEDAIKTMCGEDLGKKLLSHELVQRLATPPPVWMAWLGRKDPGPTYLPVKTFVDTFIDTLGQENKKGDGTVPSLAELVKAATAEGAAVKLLSKELAEALRAMLAEATTPEQVRQRLEEWFNGTMERWTGHFRRYTRAWMIVWAALLVLLLNIDTLKIARYLSYTPSALKALVEAAPQLAQQYQPTLTNRIAATPTAPAAPPTAPATTPAAPAAAPTPVAPGHAQPAISTNLSPEAIARLNHELFRSASSHLFGFDLPIGWAQCPWTSFQQSTWIAVLQKLFGLAISAAAISMGAPFWFDLLSRIASLRSSVKPATQSPATLPSTK